MPVLSPKGIYCPNPECKSKDVRSVGRTRPCPGMRVRYFRCLICRTRFKSTERLGGIILKQLPKKRSSSAGETAS